MENTVVVENTIQLNELLPIVMEEAYTSPFIVSAESLNFVDGKTFKFKQMSVGGYQPSTYVSGTRKTYNVGHVAMEEQAFTLSFFREFEHNAFIRDIISSGGVYNADNIINTFMVTQDAPETDAYFFSKVAQIAKDSGLSSNDKITSFTRENILDKVDELLRRGKLRTYISRGEGVLYVRPEIMDLFALSEPFVRHINVLGITEGHSISTRIARYNGVPIIEVVDLDRFNDLFDFTDGYEADGNTINMLFASPLTVKTVIAFNWLNIFAPGEHTFGASYLLQLEKWMDVFVFNNGLDNAIDSIAVSVDAEADEEADEEDDEEDDDTEVDFSELTDLIASVGELTEEDYTVDSWTALQTALAIAEGVANDTTSTQDEVDAQVAALSEAIENLVEADGNDE